MEMPSDMKTVIDAVERNLKPTMVDVTDRGPRAGSVLVVPDGMKLEDVRQFVAPRLERPERRKGTAQVTTLGSFISHTKRFADQHSALFADDAPTKPTLTAVLDYHENTADGLPRFGDHRTYYAFPLSEEWMFWMGIQKQPLEQKSFAEHLEARLSDVLDPGAVGEATRELAADLGIALAGRTRLLELSRGLSVRSEQKVVQHTNLATGEAQIGYEETHTDQVGAPLKIPGGFVIAIPVFRGGALYQIAVRLKYRVKAQQVVWSLEIHRADQSFREAFEEACQTAATETGLPLFYGKPES